MTFASKKWFLVSQHDDVTFLGVIKYLTTRQHHDTYTTLDKMKHLLVGHYVKDDVNPLM